MIWTFVIGWKMLVMEYVLDFAHYMSSFPNGRLATLPDRDYRREESNSQESKMTRFFRFLAALKGDRKVTCDINFGDVHPKEMTMCVSDNNHLSFRYGLDYEDFQDKLDNNGVNVDQVREGVRRGINTLEMPLPDAERTLLGIFNELRIHFNTPHKTVPYNFFKYALINCPNISFFQLECFNLPGYKIYAKPYNYRGADIIDPLSKAQDNIKMIQLSESIALNQDLLDLISAYLPNLEYLACRGERWSRNFFGSTVPKDVKIDLTALKKLKRFHLDLNALVPNDFDRVILCFKYTDDDERYYSIEKKDKKKGAGD